MEIVAYERQPVVIVDYDPTWGDVASFLTEVLAPLVPGAAVLHIGSTAVPGLAGKGTIDLLVVVPSQGVPGAVEALLSAGVQTRPNGFPAHRPLLFAAVQDGDHTHQVHVHVVPAGDDEVRVQTEFVTALRSDPKLREQYAALKRSIVQSGTDDPVPYSAAKDAWLAHTLRRLGLPPTPAAFGG